MNYCGEKAQVDADGNMVVCSCWICVWLARAEERDPPSDPRETCHTRRLRRELFALRDELMATIIRQIDGLEEGDR